MTDYKPYDIIGAERPSNTVVICDHAANTVPPFVNNGDLGLPVEDMQRHIAYDVGALGFSNELAKFMNAPLVHSNFSRLVIDPNRGDDDPTLVMQLYDGSIIPANKAIKDDDRQLRIDRCYQPYHDALNAVLSTRKNPCILSIHSFTKQLNGYPARPWELGVLYANDRRLSSALLTDLKAKTNHSVGDNQPYSGALKGDTMERHALQENRIHALIEIRNDLIETQASQRKWAQDLAPVFQSSIETTLMKEAQNG